ncbi:MAG TPA: DUF3149 domain-containing protein [Pelomicrobium sp.]|nr:DUF3149 domain-containing protein [Pelomicrobium sp.]
MTPALELLLKSDIGLLSLGTIACIIAIGVFLYVWISNKAKGKDD